MNKILITIAIVIVLVVIGVGIMLNSNSHAAAPAADVTSTDDNNPSGATSAGSETTNPGAVNATSSVPTKPATGGTSGGTSGSTSSGISMAVVATHNSGSSCWTAINGSVYDVTSWINQHPGGPDAILSLCGKDGSAAFNGQHGGQARPANELATFKIGVLAK